MQFKIVPVMVTKMEMTTMMMMVQLWKEGEEEEEEVSDSPCFHILTLNVLLVITVDGIRS